MKLLNGFLLLANLYFAFDDPSRWYNWLAAGALLMALVYA